MSRTIDPSRLRQLRESQHLSREQLATSTGRSFTTVVRWETGRVVPSLEAVVAIAEALSCPIDDLFTTAGAR